MGPKLKAHSNKRTTKKKSSSKMKVVEHPRSSANFFTNREIGWLNFNRRVLHEADDDRTPLLERLRFLSIASSNLDEFFMKRVGGLKRQVAYGITAKSSDSKDAVSQLKSIREYVLPMVAEQARIYYKLKPALAEQSIYLIKFPDMTSKEKQWLQEYYRKNVFSVLTPLSVDPGHPFPFISNLSTSLGVTLRHPGTDEVLFARVKVPKVLPPWIRVNADESTYRFISLLDLIKENIGDLFPNMQILNVMPFRLTRNADSDRDEEDTEDLLEMIEEELRQRRFAEVVRLEHGPNPDPWMVRFLMDELELSEEDIYEGPGMLDYADLAPVIDVHRPDLKFEPYTAVVPPALAVSSGDFFAAIRQQDHLLHHPYESFAASVERFVRLAAEDPKVLAIKMTLYRTGDNSPIVRSLIRAANEGKQVVCLIELKARFDEERNIYWAQELENAGVHVVYGIVGLKTHAKTTLVVRQEADSLRCYAHIGTGNYNVATSKFYTDMGLLTSRPEITNELVEFFNYLTGRSLKSNYQYILIAPVNMFQKFKAMIEREADHARQGRPAQIIAKFNNMEENDISLALYGASSAGVEIDLIVRGFCCIRPQVPELSERIRVQSVIGRFLEHSRIFYFRNGAKDPVDGEFFIGSADWMYRNLHARVEAIVPILDRALKEKCWEMLQLTLKDQRQTWQMNADGSYMQRKGSDPGLHNQLMMLSKQRIKIPEDQILLTDESEASDS